MDGHSIPSAVLQALSFTVPLSGENELLPLSSDGLPSHFLPLQPRYYRPSNGLSQSSILTLSSIIPFLPPLNFSFPSHLFCLPRFLDSALSSIIPPFFLPFSYPPFTLPSSFVHHVLSILRWLSLPI